jgi:ATP-dependent Clp protease adaptor protein ClpS
MAPPVPPNPGLPGFPGFPGTEEDIDVEERQKTSVPKRFKVIFHNDDYTTMEYVIEVLRRFFHKGETEALHVMLTVHKKGKALAGIYPRDVAETKVAEVIDEARQEGMPLLLTAEPHGSDEPDGPDDRHDPSYDPESSEDAGGPAGRGGQR